MMFGDGFVKRHGKRGGKSSCFLWEARAGPLHPPAEAVHERKHGLPHVARAACACTRASILSHRQGYPLQKSQRLACNLWISDQGCLHVRCAAGNPGGQAWRDTGDLLLGVCAAICTGMLETLAPLQPGRHNTCHSSRLRCRHTCNRLSSEKQSCHTSKLVQTVL